MSSMSMDLHSKQSQNVKQIQRLIMSPQMQQAIHLLQMPVMELSLAIENELQQNPVLENEQDNPTSDSELERLEEEAFDQPAVENSAEQELMFKERDFEMIKRLDDEFKDYINDEPSSYSSTQEEDKLQTFLENSLKMPESLLEHLNTQARESFIDKQHYAIAEEIIGNLDASGFLETSLAEISLLTHYPLATLKEVLSEIQTFDPPGVGAKDLQESLLIQLTALGKKNTLAYHIIDQHYEDLLHNRILNIQKGLKVSTEKINKTIDSDISKLDLRPGASYSKSHIVPLIPDVTIVQEDNEKLSIVINNDSVPPLRINQQYMRMLDDESLNVETKEFIKQKILSAKWLLRNIFQRNETIERIAQSLIARQRSFLLDPHGTLTPLTMKTLAEELSLHESTIARAISNKYIETPRGLFPLRYFFTHAYVDEKGEDISAKTVKNLLKELINQEDKSHPLSDEALSAAIKKQGIPCARRTIAKYRAELNKGNANQRRKFQ